MKVYVLYRFVTYDEKSGVTIAPERVLGVYFNKFEAHKARQRQEQPTAHGVLEFKVKGDPKQAACHELFDEFKGCDIDIRISENKR